MCIGIYTFLFQTKKANTYKKQKKLQKIEKQKKPKKKNKNKMLLLLTISVENLTGYNDFNNLLCLLLTYVINQQRESAC